MSEKKDIFEELDIDMIDVADRMSKINVECDNAGDKNDLDVIRRITDELTPIEIATLLRIQSKALKHIGNEYNLLKNGEVSNDIAFG